VHTFCFAPSSHSQRQQHDVCPIPGLSLLLKEVFVIAEFAAEGGFCCNNENYLRSVVLGRRILSSFVAGQFRATRVPKIRFQLNQRLLTKVALWRAQYDESCKLRSRVSYCLSLASMVESVREAWKMVAYPVADVNGSSPLVSSLSSEPIQQHTCDSMK